MLIIVTTVFLSITSAAIAQCDPEFELASYYASNMVLQRPPVRPRLWGYTPSVGQDVIVNLDSGGQTILTTSFLGPGGRPIWEVVFQPIQAEGPHSISVQLSGTSCVITLQNILIGDVYICSGQSNMELRMDQIDNPQPDLDDVVNYPNVRSFHVEPRLSTEPQYDLITVRRTWAVPTPSNIAPFSAVCWLFGRNLYRRFGRPIGLIASYWGGTRIEAWSSPDALDVCYETYPPGDERNQPSVMFNAMIHPFFPLPIYGVAWYQGETNARNDIHIPEYGCMLKSMVADWRSKWHARNPEMDPVFPFGQVQLAPDSTQDIVRGFPELRWLQTDAQGFAPNPTLERIYIAIAVDLPDFNSPHGSNHPRYKRPVADRLALAAFNVAYGSTDDGIYQGPLPTQISLNGSNIRIDYGMLIHYGNTSSIFEFCCGSDESATCSGGGGTWFITFITEQYSDYIELANPCSGNQVVTGFRYLWRESPCPVYMACPIYSVENNLPAPPYRYNGPIVAGRPVIIR